MANYYVIEQIKERNDWLLCNIGEYCLTQALLFFPQFFGKAVSSFIYLRDIWPTNPILFEASLLRKENRSQHLHFLFGQVYRYLYDTNSIK